MAEQKLEELCYLTAQSLTLLKTSDHFRVVKLLGEGSYGRVMLAVHKKRGTPMALKFFPRGSTSLLSFLREYNLSLSFCTHPSLSRALGIFFCTPSHYVFAQQAGLYGDLFDVIVPEVGMEEDHVQSIVSQLSGAISHLHTLGFVHRDIKPENIFLCDQACRWVKLGDFGLTRAQGTRTRAVWYQSPFCVPEMEVAKKRKAELKDQGGTKGVGKEGETKEDIWIAVEPSIDSWALGILIYCMLTGCFPWNESTADDLDYKKFKEWFDQEADKEAQKSNNREVGRKETEHRGNRGDTLSLEVKSRHSETGEGSGADAVSPYFSVFSPLALSLFKELLNPDPDVRARAEEVPGYLGMPWLVKTEKEEKRRAEEAEAEAKRVREAGCIGEKKEREDRGER
ncbi:serine/threonine-protein kinase SBK2-like [Scleropages formosus]|uniref:Serine/threonine-protein kinase SBK2-like n=1 Tax=Scleropages formosus TaxID=113540 RepID=A0A0P7Z3Q2_SCLFO|nr:serine/threonine-protein kinase SBK2-like [Scleropages formosus]